MVRTNLPASQLLKKKLLYFVLRYGRVYATAADPYHHSVGPTTTYGVGTVVSCHARTHARVRQVLIKPGVPSFNRPVCTEEDITASPRTETPQRAAGGLTPPVLCSAMG